MNNLLIDLQIITIFAAGLALSCRNEVANLKVGEDTASKSLKILAVVSRYLSPINDPGVRRVDGF